MRPTGSASANVSTPPYWGKRYVNCHCWAITCTCSGFPPGLEIGVAPWPPPAPAPARLLGASTSWIVPTIASTITIDAVTPTQPACRRRWPRTGGPSCMGPGGWRNDTTA